MPEIQDYFLIWTYCKKGITPKSKFCQYYDFHKKFWRRLSVPTLSVIFTKEVHSSLILCGGRKCTNAQFISWKILFVQQRLEVPSYKRLLLFTSWSNVSSTFLCCSLSILKQGLLSGGPSLLLWMNKKTFALCLFHHIRRSHKFFSWWLLHWIFSNPKSPPCPQVQVGLRGPYYLQPHLAHVNTYMNIDSPFFLVIPKKF